MKPTYSSIELLQIIVNADTNDMNMVAELLKEEFKGYSLRELEVINKVILMKCKEITSGVINDLFK